MTKGLDEEQIRIVAENYAYQINLAKRKEDVQRLIEVQGKLTEEICKAIEACTKLSEVEDIYRPYQQKKKTRASEAEAKGLRPLADWLLALPVQKDVLKEAKCRKVALYPDYNAMGKSLPKREKVIMTIKKYIVCIMHMKSLCA